MAASLTTQPSGARLPYRIASPPVALSGRSIGTTTCWPGVSSDGIGDLARACGRRRSGAPAWISSRRRELARHQGDAAGLVHVGGDVAPARLQIGHDRRARGDRARSRRARRGSRARARSPAGAARRWSSRPWRPPTAAAFSSASRRDDVRRAHVVAHEPHHDAPGLDRRLGLARVHARGSPFRPARADAEELERRRHRVGGELAAAGARAGAGRRLRARAARRRSSCPRGSAPTPSKTSWIVTSSPSEVRRARSSRCRARGPGRSMRASAITRGRDRLVAADEADDAVEVVAAGHELDRVRDDLAADERAAHARRAHRDAVRDRRRC